ncbi:wall-associated receptor kinase 8-like protein, partial [Trifolium pratense]
MKEPHCYAHKWFEIECKLNKTSHIHKPYLKSLNLEDVNTFLAVGCNELAFLESNGTTVGGCVSICDDNNNNFSNFNFRGDSCNGKYCCETSLPLHLSEYNTKFRGLGEQNSDNCSYALIVSKSWVYFSGSYSTSPFYEDRYNKIPYYPSPDYGSPYYGSPDYESPYYESYMSNYLVKKLNKLKHMEYAPAVFEWEILN